MAQKGFFIYGTRIVRNRKFLDGTTSKWTVAVLYIIKCDSKALIKI